MKLQPLVGDWVLEAQMEGVEEMASNKRATASIQSVTNQGMSNMSHVDSDLVGTASLQVEL